MIEERKIAQEKWPTTELPLFFLVILFAHVQFIIVHNGCCHNNHLDSIDNDFSESMNIQYSIRL